MSLSFHSVGLQVQVCQSVIVHASACLYSCRSVCWLADVHGLAAWEGRLPLALKADDCNYNFNNNENENKTIRNSVAV